ncbi:MAG: hypothetical protein DCC69_06625 [Hyphomicrobiales bacterium]|nr:MAG: hypothetical protein DCC69_06625 [Hyphomicrobiales bacterium]
MTEDAHDDPHPDDAEFERLLAYIGAALRVPEGETYAQRTERQERLRALFDALWRLQYPGWDNPAAPPPEPLPAPNWIVCDPPLVATPPAWRTSLVSVHGSEAERADRSKADAIIARAIEDAHADLDRSKRAEGPRRIALQVLDHHLVRGEPLPRRALELIGRALHIDPDSIITEKRRAFVRQAKATGRTSTEIASELDISRQAVDQLFDPYEPPNKVVFYLALEHTTEQGKPPRRDTRDEIARLLGQHSKVGRWPDEIAKAARVEAGRRAKGLAEDNDDAVAKALGHKDPRKVRRWMKRRDWLLAVTVEAFRLRGGLHSDPNHIIDYDRDEGMSRIMTRAESNAMRKLRAAR